MYLTSWPGGIQNWWSARYWGGSAQYRIKQDGTIGSRYSLETTAEEALNKGPAGGVAEGSHCEAQWSSSETLAHTDAPKVLENGDRTVHRSSHYEEWRYGPEGLLDPRGIAGKEDEQTGETRLVSPSSGTLERNHQDLEDDNLEGS